jgi:hypothetical protein
MESFMLANLSVKSAALCCLFAILALPVSGLAQAYSPKAGSAERKAIMDALRNPVERQLGKKVVFKVEHFKVLDGWAFLRGLPQQPDGKAVDYRGTPYQERVQDGTFDDGICALLKKVGDKWRVLIFQIGSTDVPWVTWEEEYKAPADIFK